MGVKLLFIPLLIILIIIIVMLVKLAFTKIDDFFVWLTKKNVEHNIKTKKGIDSFKKEKKKDLKDYNNDVGDDFEQEFN